MAGITKARDFLESIPSAEALMPPATVEPLRDGRLLPAPDAEGEEP
jgi:hypothetical protein